MRTITVDIEDKNIIKFLKALEHFVSRECRDDRCVTVSGMTIEEYRKFILMENLDQSV